MDPFVFAPVLVIVLGWALRMSMRQAAPTRVAAASPPEAPKVEDPLASDLANLDAQRPGLAGRAVRFVREGAPSEVLDELRAVPGLPVRVADTGPIGRGNARYWLKGTDLTPAQRRRLGKVYDASSSRVPRRVTFKAPGLPSGLPEWLQVLAWEASSFGGGAYGNGECWWDWPTWAAILAADGQPPDLLFRALLMRPDDVGPYQALRILPSIQGVGPAAEAHREAVRDALRHPDAKVRAHAVETLSPHLPADRVLDDVVPLALDKAKTVRTPATAWLAKSGNAAAPALREQAVSARSADARAFAIELLWRVSPTSETRTFLAEREGLEKGAAPLQAIRACLVDAAAATPAPAPIAEPVALPPIAPLDDATRTALRAALLQADLDADKGAAAWAARAKQPTPAPTRTWSDRSDLIAGLLEAPTFPPDAYGRVHAGFPQRGFWTHHVILDRMAQGPTMSLAALLRLAVCTGQLQVFTERLLDSHASAAAVKWYRARRRAPDFREYAAEMARLGATPERVGGALLDNLMMERSAWPEAGVAAFFAEHPDVLVHALTAPPTHDNWRWVATRRRANALKACAAMSRPPLAIVPLLWTLALGTVADEREAAQRALTGLDGTVARVVTALSDPKAEARRVAADWLARLRAPESIPALEAAVAKERSEPVKAAMMVALESLGVPLDRFLDRKVLQKEAEKVVAKGVPDELAWVPFARLPALRWGDDGTAVPDVIVKAWCVQAYRLKSPEPGPLLRRYAAFVRPDDAAAAGSALLKAWIAEDTRPADPDGARRQAKALAQQQAQWMQKTMAEAEEILYGQLLDTPAGSAIATKGLLAVAAALNPTDAAPLVQGYLKKWYGYRAGQCRALLQMLSWIDHPSAIQVVLATATRFRTAGIRAEAEECVKAIADRRGWTVDELADRTVPTAGFDDDGTLVVDYGPRRFVARLGDDLSIRLENADGKEIAALPEPRADDDATLAPAAKKAFAEAKKQLKAAATLQKDRLYEAMCTGRRWRGEDWRAYVLAHPLVGRLARGLVWRIERPDGSVRFARPLGDGSLTDEHDDGVEVGDGDRVSVAHALDLDADARGTWARHLADYEVAPLFPQLTRGAHRLPEGADVETEATAFRGHLIEAFKLRGRVTKLGYARGAPQDGGWFFSYLKRFPTLGLTAAIDFTGNGLPEENRTVALTTFRFLDGDGENGEARPLGQVPAVLLSEVWSDVAEVASQGTGFDPDWEAKASLS